MQKFIRSWCILIDTIVNLQHFIGDTWSTESVSHSCLAQKIRVGLVQICLQIFFFAATLTRQDDKSGTSPTSCNHHPCVSSLCQCNALLLSPCCLQLLYFLPLLFYSWGGGLQLTGQQGTIKGNVEETAGPVAKYSDQEAHTHKQAAHLQNIQTSCS